MSKKTTSSGRNHDRAADKVQTSIAIDRDVMDALDKISEREDRSRNNLITLFLRDVTRAYEKKHGITLNISGRGLGHDGQE